MNTEHFKQKLEAEKARLEEELTAMGGRNSEVAGDWEARPDDTIQTESREDVADKFEDYEERSATNRNLEFRLKEVTDALGKLAAGTYGTCEISGEPIEEDRLEANPAARTCKKHLSDLGGSN